MSIRPHLMFAFVAFASALVAPLASAQESAPAPAPSPSADHAPAPAPVAAAKPEKKPVAFHGSYILFDQSVTTQTIGLGSDYQSADPVYEWWVRFAPRYYLHETKDDDLSVNAWFNLYHEFTNSDETTQKNETVIGATSLWLQYARKIHRDGEYVTAISVAPLRLMLPTDKASRASGMLFGAGASVGISQTIPIQGKSAPALESARLGVSLIYNHPFTRATTAVNEDLDRTRQDAAGRTFLSDQLRGGTMPNHSLNVAATAGLQITPKLSFSTSYILLNSWSYRPTDASCAVQTLTGCVAVGENPDAPNFRVNTWLLTSLDYDLVNELSLGLGYYNFTGQLGPDGQRRNPLWSPDARVFFTVTANLDAVYERAVGGSASASANAALPPALAASGAY